MLAENLKVTADEAMGMPNTLNVSRINPDTALVTYDQVSDGNPVEYDLKAHYYDPASKQEKVLQCSFQVVPMNDTFSNAQLVKALQVYEKSPLHLEQNSTYLLPIDRNSIEGNQMAVSVKSDGGVTTQLLHINEYQLSLTVNQSTTSFSHFSMGGLNGHNYVIA